MYTCTCTLYMHVPHMITFSSIILQFTISVHTVILKFMIVEFLTPALLVRARGIILLITFTFF